MLKSLLRRSIARVVVVLAVGVAMAASAWAASAAEPWHPLTTALEAGVDAVGCGECGAHHHHPPQATHSHCLSCLGFPLPNALGELLPIRPAGFTFGSGTLGAGLPTAPDPDPPRTLSRRI